MRISALWAVLLVALMITGAAADRDRDYDDHQVTIINNYGVTPFVYSGYSYIPLKSAADFLGASLLWDSLHNRATLVYRGRELGLVVGSPSAYYMGRPVALPAPPIIVEGQMLVPVIVFDRYFDVPVRWEPDYNRVLILGPPGWGYYQVLPYAPPYVITLIQGYGPPPWAPAHGWRRQYGPAVYVPAPFVYYGTVYIPLRDVTGIIGAALLWDDLRNRAAITYNGREFGLVIGSPYVYYGTQTIVLHSPPVVVGGHVYVPSEFFDRHLKVPVERKDSVLKIKGHAGWRDFKLASSPPGYVYGFQEREREQKGERSNVGLPTQRGPEPGRASGPWMRSEERPGPEPGRGSGPWMRRTKSAPPAAKPSPTKKVTAPLPAAKSSPTKKVTAPPPSSKKEEPKENKGNGKGGGWFQAKDKAEKGD